MIYKITKKLKEEELMKILQNEKGILEFGFSNGQKSHLKYSTKYCNNKAENVEFNDVK